MKKGSQFKFIFAAAISLIGSFSMLPRALAAGSVDSPFFAGKQAYAVESPPQSKCTGAPIAANNSYACLYPWAYPVKQPIFCNAQSDPSVPFQATGNKVFHDHAGHGKNIPHVNTEVMVIPGKQKGSYEWVQLFTATDSDFAGEVVGYSVLSDDDHAGKTFINPQLSDPGSARSAVRGASMDQKIANYETTLQGLFADGHATTCPEAMSNNRVHARTLNPKKKAADDLMDAKSCSPTETFPCCGGESGLRWDCDANGGPVSSGNKKNVTSISDVMAHTNQDINLDMIQVLRSSLVNTQASLIRDVAPGDSRFDKFTMGPSPRKSQKSCDLPDSKGPDSNNWKLGAQVGQFSNALNSPEMAKARQARELQSTYENTLDILEQKQNYCKTAVAFNDPTKGEDYQAMENKNRLLGLSKMNDFNAVYSTIASTLLANHLATKEQLEHFENFQSCAGTDSAMILDEIKKNIIADYSNQKAIATSPIVGKLRDLKKAALDEVTKRLNDVTDECEDAGKEYEGRALLWDKGSVLWKNADLRKYLAESYKNQGREIDLQRLHSIFCKNQGSEDKAEHKRAVILASAAAAGIITGGISTGIGIAAGVAVESGTAISATVLGIGTTAGVFGTLSGLTGSSFAMSGAVDELSSAKTDRTVTKADYGGGSGSIQAQNAAVDRVSSAHVGVGLAAGSFVLDGALASARVVTRVKALNSIAAANRATAATEATEISVGQEIPFTQADNSTGVVRVKNIDNEAKTVTLSLERDGKQVESTMSRSTFDKMAEAPRTPEERLARASEIVGGKLTPEEEAAIEKAHGVGTGPIYSPEEIQEKANILRKMKRFQKPGVIRAFQEGWITGDPVAAVPLTPEMKAFKEAKRLANAVMDSEIIRTNPAKITIHGATEAEDEVVIANRGFTQDAEGITVNGRKIPLLADKQVTIKQGRAEAVFPKRPIVVEAPAGATASGASVTPAIGEPAHFSTPEQLEGFLGADANKGRSVVIKFSSGDKPASFIPAKNGQPAQIEYESMNSAGRQVPTNFDRRDWSKIKVMFQKNTTISQMTEVNVGGKLEKQWIPKPLADQLEKNGSEVTIKMNNPAQPSITGRVEIRYDGKMVVWTDSRNAKIVPPSDIKSINIIDMIQIYGPTTP